MFHLSVREPSKEDAANRFYETPEQPGGKQKRKKNGIQCYHCGSSGHLGRDPKCPAKGQTCRKYKGKDHFASVCKTKSKNRGVNQVQLTVIYLPVGYL